MIITDHGTQFRGKKYKDELLSMGVKTYKTSVYHRSSHPAERVLREVVDVFYEHTAMKNIELGMSMWKPPKPS